MQTPKLFFISFSTDYKVPSSHGTLRGIPEDNCWSTLALHRWRLDYVRYLLLQGSSQHKIIGIGKSWFNLYNKTFTDREKGISWCVYCSSELPSCAACPDKPNSTYLRSGEPLCRVFQAKKHSGPKVAFLIAIKGITAHMRPTVNSFTCVQPFQVNMYSHRTTALLKC